MYCQDRFCSIQKIMKGHFKRCLFVLFGCTLFLNALNAQENNPYIAYNVPFQNLLKFNRFLINPTFSTVREDKSYLNMFHRNQSALFEDNLQSYFLSYSGRMNDKVGLGASIYHQQEGVMSNIGIMVNYAYGVRLSDNSSLAIGVNIPYFRSGFDHGRSNIGDDPLINDLKHSSIILVQPGLNLSLGKLDFGVYAENLYDLNLATGEGLSAFAEKTFSGHIQYTYVFDHYSSLLEDARLMPLVRTRMAGGEDLSYGGALILDLPKLGWLQGGYDSFYGASAGVGFNLSRRLSLGYSFEKGLSETFGNFGVTHEVSIALSFVPNTFDDRVYLGSKPKILKKSYGKNKTKRRNAPVSNKGQNGDLMGEIEKLKKEFAEKEQRTKNLQTRIDSLEADREKERERRMRMIMNMVQQETSGTRPDLEKKAKQILIDQEQREVPEEEVDMEIRSRLVMEMVQQGMKKEQKKVGDPKKYVINNTSDSTTSQKDRGNDNNLQNTTDDQLLRQNVMDTPEQEEIVRKNFVNVPGINTGHYIVANVFGTERYLKSFVGELKRRGLDAQHFKNPENGLNYVFLARYDDYGNAVKDIRSNLKDKYFKEMWVMSVDNTRLEGMNNIKQGKRE